MRAVYFGPWALGARVPGVHESFFCSTISSSATRYTKHHESTLISPKISRPMLPGKLVTNLRIPHQRLRLIDGLPEMARRLYHLLSAYACLLCRSIIPSRIIHTRRSSLHEYYEVWKSAEGVKCLVAAQKGSFTYDCCIYYSMGPDSLTARYNWQSPSEHLLFSSWCLTRICYMWLSVHRNTYSKSKAQIVPKALTKYWTCPAENSRDLFASHALATAVTPTRKSQRASFSGSPQRSPFLHVPACSPFSCHVSCH